MKIDIRDNKLAFRGAALLVLCGLCFAPLPAQATLTFDVGSLFSWSGVPAGTQPWLTATFEQVDGDTVRLTMSTNGLSQNEFVSDWTFNLSPALSPASLSFVYVSGTQAAGIGAATNNFKADGDGYYDILFSWPTTAAPTLDSRFKMNQTSVYDISLSGGLNEQDFNFLSALNKQPDSPASAIPLPTMAHIQGLANNTSAWVTIPEPGTLFLLGFGMAGLYGYGLRKRGRK